jgi:predicted TPR repeat methyltransferase
MNTLLSPQSAAAFVSLGEAYALASQKDLAVQNYQRALKLNPEDENARKALARLGSSK